MPKKREPQHGPHSDLLPIAELTPYGVGRTTAFGKINPSSDLFDPTFPEPLLLHGKYFFLRTEILAWALQHRKSRIVAPRPAAPKTSDHILKGSQPRPETPWQCLVHALMQTV